MSNGGVRRIGDCTGCLNRGIDPNDKPCNICAKVDKPQTRHDASGAIVDQPSNNYCPQVSMKELKKKRIPGQDGDRRHSR